MTWVDYLYRLQDVDAVSASAISQCTRSGHGGYPTSINSLVACNLQSLDVRGTAHCDHVDACEKVEIDCDDSWKVGSEVAVIGSGTWTRLWHKRPKIEEFGSRCRSGMRYLETMMDREILLDDGEDE